MICGGVYMSLVVVKSTATHSACPMYQTVVSRSKLGNKSNPTYLVSALLVSLDIIDTDIIAIPRKSQSDSFPTIHQIWSARIILPNAIAFSIAGSRTFLLPTQSQWRISLCCRT